MTEQEHPVVALGAEASTELYAPPASTGLQPGLALPDEVANQYDPAKAGDSPYGDQEFQRELKEGIKQQIEGWQKDWSVRIDALMSALGLSRPEVMLYLLLMQMGTLRGMASGFQQMWNADPAQRRRAMQDKLLELELEIAARTLDLEVKLADEPALSPDEAVKKAAKGWRIP